MNSFGDLLGILLNGVATGMILFIMAVGLTVIFGLLDVLNLAHGSIFLVGSYIGYALAGQRVATWGGWAMALVVALVLGVVIGVLLMLMLRPLRRRGHLDQAVLTLGLALVITELLAEIFGRDDHGVAPPPGLVDSVELGGITYPVYRLVVIALGAVVAAGVWYVLERTSAGAVVRATVADDQMVAALGISVSKVRLLTFGGATALAVLGGVVAGPVNGVSTGLGNEILLLALVVIVIGGLGSILGTLVGSLAIGLVQNFGVVLVPELASFLLFGAMVLVILVRPQGLFASIAAVAR
ncbi:branched-chain amino acid ABC transporter permease [Streptomyces asiaticus]